MTAPSTGGDTDPRTWPVKNATSFGGVVVRTGTDGPEVALIRPGRPRRSEAEAQKGKRKEVWALPKGGKEKGETAEDAAIREVREETGLEAEVVEKIESITYWFVWAPEQVRYRKTVHFFLMRYTGGEATPDGLEVDEVRFVPLDRAAKKASYPSERKVLKRAADLASGW